MVLPSSASTSSWVEPVASVISVSVLPLLDIHWYVNVPGRPSSSLMPEVSAVSVAPTCTMPVMVGKPVAGLLMDILSVYADALSSVPSFTLNLKLAKLAPLALSAGTNLSLSLSRSFLVTVFGRSAAAIATPRRVSVPAMGRVVIFTLASVSLSSTSVNAKSSDTSNVCVSPLIMATVLSDDVGRSFTEVTDTSMV